VTDPWDEPTDEWTEQVAHRIGAGDYILDALQRRLKVLSSYSAAAGTPAWYLDAYEPGEPTRRIGCHAEQLMQVEVRG
jgi:hypothetical protein